MRNDRERLSVKSEIDLVELIEGLWRQKLLVFVVAAMVTGSAVAYAMLATPIYEAKVFLQPPLQKDIAQLNYGRGDESGLQLLTVKDVYDGYVRNLQSESLRQRFFRDVYLRELPDAERVGSQDDLYGKFTQAVSLPSATKESPNRFFIVANLPDPEMAARWVARYAAMAGDRAKRELTADVRSDALAKVKNLEQRILAARQGARKQREDEVAKLSEALRVALSIGLVKPPIISSGLSTEISAEMEGPLTYMRGSKAIEAEIENLRKRSSDDPFIAKLRQDQEMLAFYQALEVDPAVIEVYRQDGAIEIPDRPVKPRKFVIAVMGFVAGLMLGVILAIARQVLAGRSAARRV